MKRLLITTLMLLSISGLTPAGAQKSRQYDDDVYGSKPSSAQDKDAPSQSDANNSRSDEQTYSSSGSQQRSDGRNTSGQYSDEYYDSDDDYYYSSRINRFNYPFYNRPYWSSFYNPFWYDPYWVDPYWGWSPWARSGFSISIGVGGPYWSSYWGYNSWYGYPGFGSYYGYPAYSYGYGGYYSGYWNGYYAGVYGGDGYYGRHYGKTITYGPRYTLRPNAASGVGLSNNGYNGFRRAPVSAGAANAENPAIRNNGFRSEQPGGSVSPSGIREERIRETRGNVFNNNEVRANDNRAVTEERPMRNGWREDESRVRNNDAAAPGQEAAPRRERSPWFGGGRRQEENTVTPAPQREQRSFTQPRFEQRSEPAPTRSFGGGRTEGGFGGGRSSGGGSFGGGGGGRRR